MDILETIMHVLNGPHGAAVFAALRQAFLGLFFLTVLAMFLAPRPGRRQLWVLACGFALVLLGVLLNQGAWQLAGFRRPEFVRFMRFHDPRPDARLKQARRGSILDWRGTVLAQTDEQDSFARRYPLGAAACHAVGYAHPRYGMSGVERVADPSLCGYSFGNLDELDRFGRNLLDHRATSGGDVRLTLDAELQTKAYALMAGKHGAAIVLRPADGALLCLLSVPGFDPAQPGNALADRENAPLLNRAVQGLYPPGSTFKMLMAALAVERQITPTFRCGGDGFAPAPGARAIRDSEYYICLREGRLWPGHGRIGLAYAFAHSSNVYFTQLGLALGADAFNEMTARARLRERIVYFDGPVGSLTGDAGQVPRVSDRDRRALAQASIGQGKVLVTPLHVALWTAAIADEGRLRKPRLRADAEPEEWGRVTTPAAAETVKGFLRDAVVRGTGRSARVQGLAVSGKTGTAEAPLGEDHAWFTCFAPFARPELVVTVLIEHGGYGSQAAAPVARALLEKAVDLGLVGDDVRPEQPGKR